jgi:hypothetical protein
MTRAFITPADAIMLAFGFTALVGVPLAVLAVALFAPGVIGL